MEILYDVTSEKMIKMLTHSNRFTKYPSMFLGNTCKVIVNGDDYLLGDEFIIESKYKILPKTIRLYGKKLHYQDKDTIFLNYWMDVFLKTIEQGKLSRADFEKSDSKLDLCIGLSKYFRSEAFRCRTWTRGNVINFLSCLFDKELYEVNYKQQDLFEELLVA